MNWTDYNWILRKDVIESRSNTKRADIKQEKLDEKKLNTRKGRKNKSISSREREQINVM